MPSVLRLVRPVATATALLVASHASAQAPIADIDHESASQAEAEDRAAAEADAAAHPDPAPTHTRHEEEGVAYRSFGLSYRHAFAAERILELALEDAPRGVRVPQIALEYARIQDGLEVIASITYADYGFSGAFLQKDEHRYEYEWIDSNLRSVGLGASVSWTSRFSDVFAIQGGLDFGLGALFGTVRRTEAYPSNGDNPDARGGFAPCAGPTAPGQPGSDTPVGDFDPNRFSDTVAATAYCGVPLNGQLTDPDIDNGEQYGVRYRTWLDGGSLPFLSWRLAPRLTLRFKPAPRFVLRIDSGLDLGSGVFVGAGAHYMF